MTTPKLLSVVENQSIFSLSPAWQQFSLNLCDFAFVLFNKLSLNTESYLIVPRLHILVHQPGIQKKKKKKEIQKKTKKKQTIDIDIYIKSAKKYELERRNEGKE